MNGSDNMSGGPYNIPRNTKGEIRYFNIFSIRALIETLVGLILGFLISYGVILMLKSIGMKIPDSFVKELVTAVVFGFFGFAISSFKIPDTNAFELTRKVGRRIRRSSNT